MRNITPYLLVIFICNISTNIYCAEMNACTWENIQLTVPTNMIFQNKEKMAIVATSEENPSSFLVISKMNNLTSDDIIQNLQKNNKFVIIKEIKNTRVAEYSCIKIVYEHTIDKKIHISYLFDGYNIRLIFVGCYKDYELYEPIIKSLIFAN